MKKDKTLRILFVIFLIVLVCTLLIIIHSQPNKPPKWYNHICYGTVISVSDNELVIERDRKTLGEQTIFIVKRKTDVYGMKGMTEVPLSEIVPGMHVRIIYRETMRPQVGVAREVKVIIEN